MKNDKKRQYDSERTKRNLVTAAVDLFSRIGYDAATTRGIAKKAGVNESLIQRYFKNKLGLFSYVVSECKKKFHAELPYPPCDTLEEELRQFFLFRLDMIKKEKKIFRVIYARAAIDRKVSEPMKTITENGLPFLVERLERFRKMGKIREDLNLPTASILIATTSSSISMWTHILGIMDDDFCKEVVELASQVFARGFSK